MEQNKTGKYFKYAIGEIILVVIGILIALSINNWNEIRKNENKFSSNLLQVHKELALNIQNTTNNLNYILIKDSLIYSVMNNNLDVDDYRDSFHSDFNPTNGYGLSYILFHSKPSTIFNNSFNKLNQNTDNLPIKYNSIVTNLEKVYSQHRTDAIHWSDKLRSLTDINIDKFSEKHSWFHEFYFLETFNEDAIKYFIEDPIYKNYVSQYYFDHLEQMKYLKSYRFEAINSYNAITDLLELKDQDVSDSLSFNVSEEVLKCYVGIYQIGKSDTCELLLENSRLILVWDNQKFEMISLSPTKFINTSKSNITLHFVNTKNCKTQSFNWYQEGLSFNFVKVD